MTMSSTRSSQCPTCHGPRPYRRDVLEEPRHGHPAGYERHHCCCGCKEGREHSHWCKRIPFVCEAGSHRPPWSAHPTQEPGSSSKRKRSPPRDGAILRRAPSPSPSRCGIRIFDQMLPRTLPNSSSNRSWIVTLGLVNGPGPQLLQHNPILWNYVIDVRDWLKRDVPHGHRMPYGTNWKTQMEIKKYEDFPALFQWCNGHVTSCEITLLACTSGHHRSPATAEIVARHLWCLGMMHIGLIHVGINATEGGATEEDMLWLGKWTPKR